MTNEDENEETKIDEMKNRISMALKDPTLQQGFEIICKENAELRKDKKQLTKARMTIKSLVDTFEDITAYEGIDSFKLAKETKEARQFLMEVQDDRE